MSGFVGWRRGSAALLLLAAVGAAASTASARQAVKKPPQRPVPAVAVAAITAAPARFFTIDEILAERDARIAAGGNAAMGASPARATVHLANASTADTALERGR